MNISDITNEQSHENMVLAVLRKLSLQMHMRSHPVGLDVGFLVGLLVGLRECAGLPEPLLVAYMISIIIS